MEAVEDLYRAHAPGLARFALVLLGDKIAAEDVVQEAFLNLYRRWDSLADHGNMVGYLRTAVLNGCRSAQRAQARARLLRVPHDRPAWSAESAVIDGEDRRALAAAVARLPRRQREVLVLKYYLELSEQEIASLLRISRGTVSSTGARALAKLSRQLRDEELPARKPWETQ